MIRVRFSGGARTAAALFGSRIAAGDEGMTEVSAGDRRPPSWIAELDEYEDRDALAFALQSELGEVLAARIGPEADPRRRPRPRRASERGRGRCPRTAR